MNCIRSEDYVGYMSTSGIPDQSDDAIVSRAWAIIQKRARAPGQQFASPEIVSQYLSMANAQQSDPYRERFGVVFLDSQHALIAFEIMFEGTLTQTSVYPREVVRRALALNATAVILTHNHPSGGLEFSRSDEALTQVLKSALALVDVGVLDHILTRPGTGTTSMASKGLL
jgi:DNA repair protein RadC